MHILKLEKKLNVDIVRTFLQQTVFKMYVDKNYGLERRNHVNNEQLLDN